MNCSSRKFSGVGQPDGRPASTTRCAAISLIARSSHPDSVKSSHHNVVRHRVYAGGAAMSMSTNIEMSDPANYSPVKGQGLGDDSGYHEAEGSGEPRSDRHRRGRPVP
jgi:hypothetical protein